MREKQVGSGGTKHEPRRTSWLAFSARWDEDDSDGCLIQVWDADDGELLFSLDNGGMVMAVCFSEDSDMLATGVIMGKAVLWEMAGGTRVMEVAVCKGPVFCVALRESDTLHYLATGDVTG